MTELTRAAMRADLANDVFAPPAGCSHERRVGVETELIPVDAATGRRCPIEDESALSTLPFLRRYGACHGWVETKTSKGTPSFQLASGGHADLRAGRTDRVQLSAMPHAERAPRAPAVGDSSAQERGGGRRHLSPRHRHRSRQFDRAGATAARRKAVWADGRVSGASRTVGRADDAADGVTAGERRFRRRAVDALASAERRRALRRGDLRQFPAVRGTAQRLAEHPVASLARARSDADRLALRRAGAARRISRVRPGRSGDADARGEWREQVVQGVARVGGADVRGMARPPEHAVSRGASARSHGAAVGRRRRAAVVRRAARAGRRNRLRPRCPSCRRRSSRPARPRAAAARRPTGPDRSGAW